ncbi:uncharacterized protein LOC119359417 [Triticum dicoccoides]|uniref:uncharacterized protein LOC119359417 n=1 Tax=Triticum dicoccoides TaxID=85692 RepID=UPI0018903326|nr:uncharacterized protein LOC119359417 [Triticum dicoccoides]
MDTPMPKRPRLVPAPAPVPRRIADMAPEILLRLPPDDPTRLVRASLVCWRWRHLLTDPAYLRRYRAFHRTPSMLGFVLNLKQHYQGMAQLVPTSSFCPAASDRPDLNVLDARHGRVLLHTAQGQRLVVWDPVKGEEFKIPHVPAYALGFNAVVLCAAVGCDHLDCHGGPFRVAFMGCGEHGITFACTYSSEAGAWSQRVEIEQPAFVDGRPSFLVGYTLYFTCNPYLNFRMLGYDIIRQELSVIWPPSQHEYYSCTVLVKAEDDRLGFAGVRNGTLYLWSMKDGANGEVEWVQRRVIQHETMLHTRGLSTPPEVVGFADGHGLIFVRAGNTVFSMELKSGHVRKVYTCRSRNYDVIIVPYMSFCTPDRAMGKLPSP